MFLLSFIVAILRIWAIVAWLSTLLSLLTTVLFPLGPLPHSFECFCIPVQLADLELLWTSASQDSAALFPFYKAFQGLGKLHWQFVSRVLCKGVFPFFLYPHSFSRFDIVHLGILSVVLIDFPICRGLCSCFHFILSNSTKVLLLIGAILSPTLMIGSSPDVINQLLRSCPLVFVREWKGASSSFKSCLQARGKICPIEVPHTRKFLAVLF